MRHFKELADCTHGLYKFNSWVRSYSSGGVVFQAMIDIMAELAKASARRRVNEQFTFSSKRTKRMVYALIIIMMLAITVGVYWLFS